MWNKREEERKASMGHTHGVFARLSILQLFLSLQTPSTQAGHSLSSLPKTVRCFKDILWPVRQTLNGRRESRNLHVRRASTKREREPREEEREARNARVDRAHRVFVSLYSFFPFPSKCLTRKLAIHSLFTWASNFVCDLTVPGAHNTIPRRTSSRFTPRTSAPKLSPASPRSRSLWNISIPGK